MVQGYQHKSATVARSGFGTGVNVLAIRLCAQKSLGARVDLLELSLSKDWECGTGGADQRMRGKPRGKLPRVEATVYRLRG